MIPRDWTIFETTPALILAVQIDWLPAGSVHIKVRYLDRRTDEEGEIERVAASLTDCIHEIGRTIRDGSASGRPARPLTSDAVVELICRYMNRNGEAMDRQPGE